MTEAADREAIRAVLRALSTAWREGRFDDLAAVLREDVVFVQPGFAGRVDGRAACVESYREFMTAAAIHSYREHEPSIDLFGDAAIANCGFEIEYSLAGERYRERGRDVLALVRETDGWKVAWRTLIAEIPPS